MKGLFQEPSASFGTNETNVELLFFLNINIQWCNDPVRANTIWNECQRQRGLTQ